MFFRKYRKTSLLITLSFILVSSISTDVRIKAVSSKVKNNTIILTVGKSFKNSIASSSRLQIKWKSGNKKIASVNSKGLINAKSIGNTTITASLSKKKYSYKVYSIPKANNKPYTRLDNCKPQFTAKEKRSILPFEKYSNLDSMRRCGVAYANICEDIMPTEARGAIGNVKPSGWHTVKYPEIVDGLYLYNRCHLIGFQLAGENANAKNLITGTRYFNVTGMEPFENKVADYVRSTRNHVLYRVSPAFTNNNLVADGVQMEAWSVEDNGKGICFNVFCYNIQPGINIDYTNGDSHESGDYDIEDNSDLELPSENNSSSATHDITSTYVLNTNTKKFHYSSCRDVSKIAEKNYFETDKSREELLSEGYLPCGHCKP